MVAETSCKTAELINNLFKNGERLHFILVGINTFNSIVVKLMYGFISLQQAKKGAKPAGKRGKGKKKSALKYIIDCTHPVEDGIMDVVNFVRFLK